MKALLATAFALAALAATPLAQAGIGVPQGPSPGPSIIAV